MRYAPHPLTAIVAKATQSSPPSALLVSSFNTITLAPTPYVSFNIKVPSSTYNAIRSSGRFMVSVVNNAQTAEAFTTQDLWQDYIGDDEKLRPAMGGAIHMQCYLVKDKCVEIGDHIVVVGEVIDGGQYADAGSDGLVYWRGKYRNIGNAPGAH